MKTNLEPWYYLAGTIKALDIEKLTVQQQNEGVEITIKTQQENSTGQRHSSFKTRSVLPDSLVISTLLLIAGLKLKFSTSLDCKPKGHCLHAKPPHLSK